MEKEKELRGSPGSNARTSNGLEEQNKQNKRSKTNKQSKQTFRAKEQTKRANNLGKLRVVPIIVTYVAVSFLPSLITQHT